MATKVLRPQDVLVQRFRVHTTPCPRRRDFPAKGASLPSDQNQQRRPSTKNDKNRSTTETRKPNQGGDPLPTRSGPLLRRGESLNSLATKVEESNPIGMVVEDPAAIRARSDSELSMPGKMATKVLRPQDVLVQRFRVHTTPCPCRRDFPANGASTSLPSDQNQQRRPSTKNDKNRSTTETRKPNQGGDSLPTRSGPLLRRGESLDSLATKVEGSNPIGLVVEDPAAIRARSDSELSMPGKVRKAPPPAMVDAYAGATFDSSPSPRCLPLPTFFSKKDDANEAFEDGATRSLRRRLRLE